MVIESAISEEAIAANLKQFLLVLAVSLGVATLPQIFSWFRQIPYTLLLVIAGLGLAIANVHLVTLSPQLILSIFLPPLLFEAAWNLRWPSLKRDLLPICLYAVVGVVISVVGVAFSLNLLTGLSLNAALLIAASLSATDPVSVTALFRELGVDKRLTTLIEGESLFNDGMAVVAFSFLMALSLGTTEWGIQPILVNFFTVIGIGIAVGGAIGFGISFLTQRFDSPLVEQSLTLVSAYGTYIITEDLGGSAVIGVVTTGLILGNFGSCIGMSPRTRVIVTEFWEFLAFFVNSIVFLLIGDQLRFNSLRENLTMIAVTVGAMILMRAVAILSLSKLSHLLKASKIPLPEQTILWWGGLRGSVSIALAFSIPKILLERDEIIAVVFGAVLFTLLFQGLTIKPFLLKLNLMGNQTLRQKYLELVARVVALNRVIEHLQAEPRPGIKPEFCRYQEGLIQEEMEHMIAEIQQLQQEYPNLQNFAVEQLQEELLAIEMDSYAKFVRTGQLNKELTPLLEKILAKKTSLISDQYS
ncbi:MAG: sodium:proton antiporter [Rhizonema sp. PD37]|nr:sodium:proton antiporter [Rhizonema sp. PD37]